MTTGPDDAEIAAILMDLAHRRGVGKTFCPSEAARMLDPESWRARMVDVRRVAATLPLRASQKGTPVDPVSASGPIRLGLAENPQETD